MVDGINSETQGGNEDVPSEVPPPDDDLDDYLTEDVDPDKAEKK